MYPASTKGGGNCFGFPDVCKVPAPPAPFAPVPFPNTAMCSSASGDTCSSKVKILNKVVLLKSTEIPSSQGDEPGTLKGMVSATQMAKVVYRQASVKVMVEGQGIVTVMKSTAHNGSNANMPAGAQVAPSQMKVIVGG